MMLTAFTVPIVIQAALADSNTALDTLDWLTKALTMVGAVALGLGLAYAYFKKGKTEGQASALAVATAERKIYEDKANRLEESVDQLRKEFDEYKLTKEAEVSTLKEKVAMLNGLVMGEKVPQVFAQSIAAIADQSTEKLMKAIAAAMEENRKYVADHFDKLEARLDAKIAKADQ